MHGETMQRLETSFKELNQKYERIRRTRNLSIASNVSLEAAEQEIDFTLKREREFSNKSSRLEMMRSQEFVNLRGTMDGDYWKTKFEKLMKEKKRWLEDNRSLWAQMNEAM